MCAWLMLRGACVGERDVYFVDVARPASVASAAQGVDEERARGAAIQPVRPHWGELHQGIQLLLHSYWPSFFHNRTLHSST